MRIAFRPDLFATAWQESLTMLKPTNLYFLFLVSLRALKDTYKSLCFVWFIPTALLGGLIFELPILLWAFYIVLLARAMRPSIKLKKGCYWSHVNIVDWVIFGSLLFMKGLHYVLFKQGQSIFSFIYAAFLKILFLGNFLWLPGLPTGLTFFLSPFIIVWIFFLLDSRVLLKEYLLSFWRALLMFIYNYPFFLLSYLAFRLLIALPVPLYSLFVPNTSLALFGWLLLYLIAIPFYCCFIMSFYVKKLHEQFNIYF